MSTALQFGPYATPDDPFSAASLTGLGVGAYALGSAIDNSGGLYTLCDVNIVLPAGMTSTTNGTLVFYFLPSVDGTNYPNPPGSSAAAPSPSHYAGQYVFNGSSSTVLPITGLALPNAKFKPLLWNNSSVALPAISTTGIVTFSRYTLIMA